MTDEGIVFLLVAGAMIAMLLYGLYFAIKNRGEFTVVSTVGKIEATGHADVRTTFTVHHLKPRDPTSPNIGLTIKGTNLPLTRAQALALSRLLKQAVAGGTGRS